MLMGSDNGGINHCVFIVGVTCQSFEKILPNTVLRPPRKAAVGILPVAKALWQIPPWRARPELPDHRFDKQSIAALAITANMTGTSRQ